MKLTYSLLFLSLSFLAKAQLDHLEWQVWETGTTIQELKTMDEFRDVPRDYLILNFANKLTKAQHDALKVQDVQLLEYYSKQSYLVSFPKKFDYTALGEYGVSKFYKGQLSGADGSQLQKEDIPGYSIDGDKLLLSVQYPKDLLESIVIANLSQQDFEVILHNGMNNVVHVSVADGDLSELYKVPFLFNIESVAPPSVPDDQRGRNLHRVNSMVPPHTFESGYTGSGVNIMVRDDGEIFEHVDFFGRLEQNRNTASRGSHGDGVAGIMGGAGNLDPEFQGMAYGSTIYGVSYNADFLDFATSFHIREDDVRVTNSSFSNGCNRGYTNEARTVDQQIFDNPELMHVFSAGNNGQVDCSYGAGTNWGNITGGHKQGKNVIATANTDFRGRVLASSSRGPALDGRIKPEIAANGFNHVSTDESQDYMVFGGTSAAAPVVAGVMAILHEAHEDIVGSRAPAALLKAIMMNTANDRGNPGPDFLYGFGLLNARKALSVLQNRRFREGVITQNEQSIINIPIPENAKGVRVMTYWPDPESVANGSRVPALINDLDSRIEVSGLTYLPYVLNTFPDPDSLNLPAQPGIDRLNNMEQIEFEVNGQDAVDLVIEGFNVPFGEAIFYVTWEYLTDGIIVTYPNGGENLEVGETDFVQWDADGNDGQFLIELMDSTSNVIESITVNGDLRIMPFSMPEDFTEGMKFRVSRDGFQDESDSSFTVASKINESSMKKVEADLVFTWDSVPRATSYNIFILGDKYMEKVTEITDTSFVLPDEPLYKNTWIAASANFPGGGQGTRSIAIRTDQPAEFLFSNTANDNPCIDQPVIFKTTNPQAQFSYRWRFGTRATPRDANGPGPHEVVYTRSGTQSGRYFIADQFGEESVLFRMNVQDNPSIDSINEEEIDLGLFQFEAVVDSGNEYLWDFGDGNTSTEEMPFHQYENSGLYDVKLTLTSPCGEVDFSKEIEVVQTVSTQEITKADFSLSPNPNDGDFAITLPELNGKDAFIQLISIDGRVIEERPLSQQFGQEKVYFNNIPSGQYVLSVSIEKANYSFQVSVQ